MDISQSKLGTKRSWWDRAAERLGGWAAGLKGGFHGWGRNLKGVTLKTSCRIAAKGPGSSCFQPLINPPGDWLHCP